MLALAEVQEGHDGCFLVLGRVAFEDFGDDLLIGVVEGKGEAGVVVVGVAVLEKVLLVRGEGSQCRGVALTTERVSLRWEEVDEKGRSGTGARRGAFMVARDTCRSSCGANLDAILASGRYCNALDEAQKVKARSNEVDAVGKVRYWTNG